jgi:hypothetical protein
VTSRAAESVKESKKVNSKRNIFLQHVVFRARQATRNPATNFFVRFCASELSQLIYLYLVKTKTVLHESAPICTNLHELAPIGTNRAASARSRTQRADPGRFGPAPACQSDSRSAEYGRYGMNFSMLYKLSSYFKRIKKFGTRVAKGSTQQGFALN